MVLPTIKITLLDVLLYTWGASKDWLGVYAGLNAYRYSAS